MVPLAICFRLIKFLSRAVFYGLRNLFGKPDELFKGKVAIVTGSTRGIGKTIAWYLCKRGACVMLNGRNAERLQSTFRQFINTGFRVAACRANVAQQDDCGRLINETLEKFGRIDILVNNAGIGSRGFFEHTLPEVYFSLIHTNVLGSIYPTQLALPYIKEKKGNVLFISSFAGFRGLPNRSPYSMSKMMLTSLAESLRKEFRKNGVHVGIIYVGGTENDPGKQIIQQDGTTSVLGGMHSVFIDSQNAVAKAVIGSMVCRQFKTIIGAKGMIYHFLQKYAPWFVEFGLRLSLQTIRKYDN